MRLQLLICYLWIRSKVGKIYVQTETHRTKDNHDDWVWWMIKFFETQILWVSERLYLFSEISNWWWVYLDTLLPHRRHFTVFRAIDQKCFLPAFLFTLGRAKLQPIDCRTTSNNVPVYCVAPVIIVSNNIIIIIT